MPHKLALMLSGVITFLWLITKTVHSKAVLKVGKCSELSASYYYGMRSQNSNKRIYPTAPRLLLLLLQ